jgi:hypothetical protein
MHIKFGIFKIETVAYFAPNDLPTLYVKHVVVSTPDKDVTAQAGMIVAILLLITR